jgi:hypothetical protein
VREERKRAHEHNSALAKCEATFRNKPDKPTSTAKGSQGTSTSEEPASKDVDLSERLKSAKKSAADSEIKTQKQLDKLKVQHQQAIQQSKDKWQQEQAAIAEEQRRLEEAEALNRQRQEAIEAEQQEQAVSQRWAALAYSSDGATGWAYNAGSSHGAEQNALSQCRRRSSGCGLASAALRGGCLALAWCRNSNHGAWVEQGDTRADAERRALNSCWHHSSPNCYIKAWVCQ